MPTQVRTAASITHAMGGVIGGAAVALGLWLVASPVRTMFPSSVAAAIAVAVALLAVALDTTLLKVPSRRGQVPAVWLGRYGHARSYALYGLMFGAAFATVRTYASTYALFAALGLVVGVEMAVVAGAAFGFGRTAPIGPASFAANTLSKVLYRDRRVHKPWRAVSVVLSVVLVVSIASAMV